ncbi:hypothetical protein AGRO_0092 [Agrobacterium sp. ATCC 31749]|uniref:hypothetical protein n=1 Tax=unclassified Agrobacterium TaxID=2632611 RepID=UPI00020DB8EC|nr:MULTISPECIES: hypothetical protein [unclassified Agrobacterium]EGL67246.1 hypothetical protein AGRO_0092 [Agrobacterium sp. ATCC 31749]
MVTIFISYEDSVQNLARFVKNGWGKEIGAGGNGGLRPAPVLPQAASDAMFL